MAISGPWPGRRRRARAAPVTYAGGFRAQECDDGGAFLRRCRSDRAARRSRSASCHSSVMSSVIAVTIGPGATTLQVMLRRASSRATLRVRPDAGRLWRRRSWPGPAWPMWPLTDDDVHDAAVARRIIPGVARRMVWNAPVRLVSITARHCSSVMRATRPSRVMPALFTRIGDRAERALDLAERGVDGRGVGDVGTAPRRPCALGLDRASASRRAPSASDAVAEARPDGPARASATAIARPMPRDAPVTNATRSAVEVASLTRAPTEQRAAPRHARRRSPSTARGRRRCTRPSSTASNSASGIDADDVLP